VYALAHNHIEEVYTVAIYDHEPLFIDYVDFFYNKRLEAKASGNHADSFICKLFLNSFYGKFGQKGRIYRNVETDVSEDYKVWYEVQAETLRKYFYRQIGNLTQTIEGETEGQDSHPAIAAHVTAEARMYLWRLIQYAGIENVHYCDTDSLFTTAQGFQRLSPYLQTDELGALKLEDRAETLVIWGPKDYHFGDTAVQKGIRLDAEWLDSSTLKQLHFRSLKSLLALGDVSHPQMVYVTKHLDRTYKKGHVLRSGRTRPYDLPVDEIPL